MNKEIRSCMEEVKRNHVGRLVIHAETALGLAPMSTPGMLESMFPGDFEQQTAWLTKRLEETGGPQFTHAWFGFDEGPAWPGMHDGSVWNGWAKPQFCREVADEIIAFLNEQAAECELRSYYSSTYDAYVLGWELAEKGEEEPLENYIYRRNSKTGLFPVGSGSLTWNLYADEEAAEINVNFQA